MVHLIRKKSLVIQPLSRHNARAATRKAAVWKDPEEALKKNLFGLERPIAILDSKARSCQRHPRFPQGDRKDVDRIGQACCDVLAIF